MAMGIPLFCNAGVGDTDKIVNEYRAGYVIQQLDERHYKEIPELDNCFDRSETIKGAREFYGLEEGVRNYERVYATMLEDSKI